MNTASGPLGDCRFWGERRPRREVSILRAPRPGIGSLLALLLVATGHAHAFGPIRGSGGFKPFAPFQNIQKKIQPAVIRPAVIGVQPVGIRPAPRSSAKYCLRASNGTDFLQVTSSDEPRAMGKACGPWETFTIEGDLRVGGKVTLKSNFGKFLSAQANGRLEGNRTAVGGWEQFVITAVGKNAGTAIGAGDKVFLRSFHGKWLQAAGAGGSTANAAGGAPGPWETFVLVGVTGQTTGGSTGVAPTLYGIDAAGQLSWNEHVGYAAGSASWKSGTNRVVGSGWGGFRAVFAGGRGSVYVIRPNGDLAQYRHTGRSAGTASWAGPKVVGNGWGDVRHVFAAADGVIYAIMTNGDLRWYRHVGQASLTPQWQGGHPVGSGWAGFDLVFAGSDGVIYARKPGGQLLWYRHTGHATGAKTWGPGSGNVVGSNGLRSMAAGPDGVIYGLQPNGDLLWYRHLGAADGSPRWAGGGKGIQIGSGWNYKQLFAPPPEAGGGAAGLNAPAAVPPTLAAALQGDRDAGSLQEALQRPDVKRQLDAAYARVTAADTELGAAIKKVASLARNPAGLFGEWKTKSVCAKLPTCRTVSKTRRVNDCKWKRGCKKVKFWGIDFSICGCRTVRVGPYKKEFCADRYWDCSDKKNETYNATECTMVNQCKSVRYFDLTAGKIFQAARKEAEKKLADAKADFEKLKKKVADEYEAAKKKVQAAAAEARRRAEAAAAEVRKRAEAAVKAAGAAIEKAKNDAIGFAKKSWSDIQAGVNTLWASATAGAKELIRKVFTFVINMVLKLIQPILAKTSVAMSTDTRGWWNRYAALGRRQARAANQCDAAPRTNWSNDPLRRVQHAFSLSLKAGMMLATKAMGYASVWSKFFGVAEIARWKGWQEEYLRKATKLSKAAEWLKKALRIPRLIELLQDLKTSLANGKRAAQELWETIQEIARRPGVGAKIKKSLSDLADNIAARATALGEKIGPPLRRFALSLRNAAHKLVLSAGESLAARAAKMRAWATQFLKRSWEMLARNLRPLAKTLKSPMARFVAEVILGPGFLDTLEQVRKALASSSGGEGVLKKIKTKVLGLWTKFKGVAQPFLASMASRAASAGGKAASAAAKAKAFFAKAGAKAAQAAKKLGVGPLMVAAQWAALAIAYPYADVECANVGSQAYRACYVGKFAAFSKQVFFDAIVGTVMEGLDAALITPASIALTAAVTAAVAASFTPATAATMGAVIGIGTKFAIIIGLTMAADWLFPWYEQTVWKQGAAVPTHFEQRGDEGADLFGALRLNKPDRNAGLLCQGRYFKSVGEKAGYDGLEMSNYGNWCGPGGGGPTQDAYDQCCVTHDRCYETNRCSITSDQCSSACYRCDDEAVKCWQKARRNDPKRFGSGSTMIYPCHGCETTGRGLPALRSCDRAACNAAEAPTPVAGTRTSTTAATPKPTATPTTTAAPRPSAAPGPTATPGPTAAPRPTPTVRPTPQGAIRWRPLAGQAIHCGPGGCLASGPGCDTRAVPGQCSFPRAQAQALCAGHPQCKAVTCNGGRADCQARRVTKPSAWRGFTSYVKIDVAARPTLRPTRRRGRFR